MLYKQYYSLPSLAHTVCPSSMNMMKVLSCSFKVLSCRLCCFKYSCWSAACRRQTAEPRTPRVEPQETRQLDSISLLPSGTLGLLNRNSSVSCNYLSLQQRHQSGVVGALVGANQYIRSRDMRQMSRDPCTTLAPPTSYGRALHGRCFLCVLSLLHVLVLPSDCVGEPCMVPVSEVATALQVPACMQLTGGMRACISSFSISQT